MAKAMGFTVHLVIGNADTLNSKAPACRVMIGGQGLYYYGVKTGTPQSGEMNRTGVPFDEKARQRSSRK